MTELLENQLFVEVSVRLLLPVKDYTNDALEFWELLQILMVLPPKKKPVKVNFTGFLLNPIM